MGPRLPPSVALEVVKPKQVQAERQPPALSLPLEHLPCRSVLSVDSGLEEKPGSTDPYGSAIYSSVYPVFRDLGNKHYFNVSTWKVETRKSLQHWWAVCWYIKGMPALRKCPRVAARWDLTVPISCSTALLSFHYHVVKFRSAKFHFTLTFLLMHSFYEASIQEHKHINACIMTNGSTPYQAFLLTLPI